MATLILVLMVVVIVTGVLISAIAWRYASDARQRDVARAALLRHAATSDSWDDRLDRLDHLEPLLRKLQRIDAAARERAIPDTAPASPGARV